MRIGDIVRSPLTLRIGQVLVLAIGLGIIVYTIDSFIGLHFDFIEKLVKRITPIVARAISFVIPYVWNLIKVTLPPLVLPIAITKA